MRKRFTTLLTAFASLVVISSAFVACTKSEPVEPGIPVVQVPAMLSLTGTWSSLGLASKAALEVAQQDINTYLDGKNAGFRIQPLVADSKLDTTVAKRLFMEAVNGRYSFLIGPQSSAELAAIKPLVDKAQVVVISQSSTAGSLAIAGDAIFRFCPSDKVEGAAMAKTINEDGIKGVVTVARDDAGNKGLQSSTGAEFTKLGGEVEALAPYGTAENIDFAPVVANIKAKVLALTATHGEGHVAVYLASFDEIKNLFKAAAAEPVLKNVKWYGSDGVVQSAALTSDAVAADFAIATEYFAPAYGLSPAYESRWKPIAERIKKITGNEPDAFALVVYDALWTIARTVEASKTTPVETFAQLKTLFTTTANKNEGITGPDVLNEAGDRADGTFDYWSIVKEGSTYKWVLTGKSND
ncbi:hypothetical protein DJ568_04620 [Mucilaginibacter hurinus]|uniref:Receptor ligand binding region domain-containing protein n=1 Tax=Mucilaginibacter hurinus TaxID=2201324 RepID=A0A367GT67_9SPHI|nr:ABC transporter substrate-binding protein [Mucilaginibacter hurinus]RCH56036.1 hypothetical protein DJ568_04620 [Mucilaginibacter hurinus]